jgi:hypothetical protein
VTAGAPAEDAHLRAVDDPLRDQVIDAGHDVFVAPLEVIADDVGLVRLAVVRRPAIVGTKHDVSCASIHLGAVAAVEPEHVRACGPAVDRDDEGIAATSLIPDWFDEHSGDCLAVR